MYEIGDKLLVTGGAHHRFEDRIGQIGTVEWTDTTNIKLAFKTESEGFMSGWFLFSEVRVVGISEHNSQTITEALDFLISQGYTVSLSKA